MNYGIIIYENEDYLYKLLKFRLSTFFPNSYIIRGISDLDDSLVPLAENIHILYDSTQFTFEQVCRFSENISCPVTVLPLFNDLLDEAPTIDCSYLFSLITETEYSMNSKTNLSINSEDKCKTVVLIPFSYIHEREALIKNELANLKEIEMCIRLDLMAGIRMPFSFTGTNSQTNGLSELLFAAKQKKLTPDLILSMCGPDNNGFMSFGKPYHSDDVFDYDISTIENLISTASELTKNPSYPMNLLVVAEGFKIKDLARIASLADELHILIPERLYNTDLGFKEEIGSITRSFDAKKPIVIHHVEKLKMDRDYETMQLWHRKY